MSTISERPSSIGIRNEHELNRDLVEARRLRVLRQLPRVSDWFPQISGLLNSPTSSPKLVIDEGSNDRQES